MESMAPDAPELRENGVLGETRAGAPFGAGTGIQLFVGSLRHRYKTQAACRTLAKEISIQGGRYVVA